MITEIAPHLSICHGHINVGILRDGNRALVIDFGDGSVVSDLDEIGTERIDMVLFTHHHRDQACGIAGFADRVGAVAAPAGEERWFADVESYWDDPKNRWRLYTYHPHRLMLAESVRVDRSISDGDAIDWGPARITAMATPGHTDGSLSYLVEVDGLRAAFCGDLIHSPGRIWELWSMQKQFGVQDYHGFLGSREELIDSLRRLQSTRPDVFTDHEIDYILRNLAERERLFGELLAWDHPNYGMDESWVRCHPYEQRVTRGGAARIDVVVTNHSAVDHEVSAQLVPPPSWRTTEFAEGRAVAPAKGVARVPMTVTIPPDAAEGRHVVAANVEYAGRRLPQFAEAVIVVSHR